MKERTEVVIVSILGVYAEGPSLVVSLDPENPLLAIIDIVVNAGEVVEVPFEARILPVSTRKVESGPGLESRFSRPAG